MDSKSPLQEVLIQSVWHEAQATVFCKNFPGGSNVRPGLGTTGLCRSLGGNFMEMNDLITWWFRIVGCIGHNVGSTVCHCLKSFKGSDHNFRHEIFISPARPALEAVILWLRLYCRLRFPELKHLFCDLAYVGRWKKHLTSAGLSFLT